MKFLKKLFGKKEKETKSNSSNELNKKTNTDKFEEQTKEDIPGSNISGFCSFCNEPIAPGAKSTKLSGKRFHRKCLKIMKKNAERSIGRC